MPNLVDNHSSMPAKDDKVIIIGAGVFGLSTAEHLLKRGYTDITVLDRSEVLPAPDAASCDMNKGVCLRSSSFSLVLTLCSSTKFLL